MKNHNIHWFAPLLLLTTLPAMAHQSLDAYQADYELSHGSIHAADSRFVLQPADQGGYIYESVTHPVGFLALFRDDTIIERSYFSLVDGALRPLTFRYTYRGSDKNRNQSLDFDWLKKVVRSDYRGDKATLSLTPGMLDPLLVQLAVTLDLQHSHLADSYRVIDRGVVKTYRLEQTGHATVEVPAGTYNTVVVQRLDDDKTVLFWCAPELDYLPVKIEMREPDKSTISMMLKNYQPKAEAMPAE